MAISKFLPRYEKKKIEDALADLRKALEGEDNDAIKASMEALTQASAQLAEQANNVRDVTAWFQLGGGESAAASATRRANDGA